MKILKPPTDQETFEAFDELSCVHKVLGVCEKNDYFDKKVIGYLIDHKLLNSLTLNNIFLLGAAYGDLEIIKLTLNLGADINYKFEGETENIICDNNCRNENFWLYKHINALEYAVRNNHLACAKYLVDNGIDVSNDLLEYFQRTNFKMVKFIIEDIKLDVNNFDAGYSCFYDVASIYMNQPDNKTIKDIFNYLKSKNAKIYLSEIYMDKAKKISDHFKIPVTIIHSKTHKYGTYRDTKIVIKPDK